MHLKSLTLAFLASATSVVANDVVSIFLPEADPQPIVGKVIGVDGPFTSYVLYCAPGTDESDCGLPPDGFTVAQGASTNRMIYSYQDYVQSRGCQIGNKSVITCDIKMHDATTTRATSDTLTTTSLPYLPVTITATETGATNKATATASSASATGTAKSTLSTTASGGASASATGTSANGSATDSSNAALAQATGHAGLIAGGAAMALALAMA